MISEQNYKGEITHFAAFGIESTDRIGFLPSDYSKFKHGANDIARKFGEELAERFIEQCFPNTYDGKRLVVIPSAYSHIPTASYYMAMHFVNVLNVYLYQKKHSVVEVAKINRTVTYREDYGEMSAEERFNLIKGDKFVIDKAFLADKRLIFIDDIKITGTHERIIVKMLNDHDISNDCYMLYYGELRNKNIPPNIENYLNNYSIKSLNDIEQIINSGHFVFNTRVVKLILNAESKSFRDFIYNRDKEFVKNLYYNAVGNEYFKFNVYLQNLNELSNIVNCLSNKATQYIRTF